MKSTQDLSILLNQIAAANSYELASIEIFTDKSFRITGYKEDDSKLLYDSDLGDLGDINDLPYASIEAIMEEINAQSNQGKMEIPILKPVSYNGVDL